MHVVPTGVHESARSGEARTCFLEEWERVEICSDCNCWAGLRSDPNNRTSASNSLPGRIAELRQDSVASRIFIAGSIWELMNFSPELREFASAGFKFR
jgi:hypothetical protein